MTRATTDTCRAWPGLFLVLTACTGLDRGADDTAACPGSREPGEIYVGEAPCSDAWPGDGEATSTDVLLANHWLRAAVHHPSLAQTVVGIGGGTLVDVAPDGWNDRLFEAVPLVDGGWLAVDSFEVDGQGVTVSGPLAPLPGLADVDTATRASVRWSISADGPWLTLEGADGLWLHVAGAVEVEAAGTLRIGRQVYAHDGVLVEDLGGAVIIEGLTRLIVADAELAWASAFADGQALSGEVAGGDQLWLYDSEGTLVGSIPLEEETFSTRVPAEVVEVRASGEERGVGPGQAIGEELVLEPGGIGSFTILPDWQGASARPLWLTWSDDAGRSGRGLLSADGGTLREGAGSYVVTLDGGPTVAPVELAQTVLADAEASAAPAVETHFETGGWVLAELDALGSQSRTRRWSNGEIHGRAAGRGVRYLVMGAEDVIADTTVSGTAGDWVIGQDGTLLQSDYRIWTWPRSASSRQAGGGALDPRAVPDAELALDASIGQLGTSRHSMVDLDWLDAAPAPYLVDPQPDLVRLEAPGTAGPESGAWASWYAWLDAGMDLHPVGPWVWADVPDPDAFGSAEVERALFSGSAVATTGPLLLATVEGEPPGSVVPGASTVDVEVRDSVEGVDRIGVVVDGRLHAWGAAKHGAMPLPDDGGWAVVAAWSTTDADRWAVTGPFWLDVPAGSFED